MNFFVGFQKVEQVWYFNTKIHIIEREYEMVNFFHSYVRKNNFMIAGHPFNQSHKEMLIITYLVSEFIF